MTKPVWPACFGLECLDFNERAHIVIARKPEPRLQISACKSNSSPNEHSSQIIPDYISYIIGVFCYNFKSQTHILASN